ncbi:Ig-like domain repeat protein, partial [Bacillus sp. FJAT-50051]|nr:Ig-like domain repeat protein [Neobacillus citreus]
MASAGSQAAGSNVEINNTSLQTAAVTESVYPDDLEGPVLGTVNLSASEVNVGDNLVVTADVTDEQSGVQSVSGYMVSPGNSWRILDFKYDDQTKKWTATYPITETMEPGVWTLSDIELSDKAGNYVGKTVNQSFTVLNASGDYTRPVLNSLVLSTNEVSLGETIVFTADAQDDQSGVESVSAFFHSSSTDLNEPSGSGYVDFTYDEASGKWVGKYTITKKDKPGQWMVDQVMIRDKAGNSTYASSNKTFTVNNPDADYTAPVLETATMTSGTVTVGDEIKIKVKAHDDKSGIARIYALLYDQNHMNGRSVELHYDQNNSEWVGSYVVGPRDQSGEWAIDSLQLEDNVGNVMWVTPPGLTVTIDNPNADFIGPVISNITLNKASVNVGERVTVTADVKDDKSGVKNVYAFLNNETFGATKYLEFRYDAATQKWTGSFEIMDTTPAGEWTVQIQAADKAYNHSSVTWDKTFTVVNPEGDYTGPVVKSLEVSPSVMNAGEKATFTAEVQDDQSGVGSVWFYSEYFGMIDFKRDSTTGKWVSNVTVPTNIPDGAELYFNVGTFDLKGNYGEGPIDQPFIVNNPNGDYTAPVVDQFDLSAATVEAGDSFELKAKVSDDKSGVKTVKASFGYYGEMSGVNLTYDAATDAWTGTYNVSKYENPGEWAIYLWVEDQNGNMDNVAMDQTVTITNEAEDRNAPIIEGIEITPSTVNNGGEVTVSFSAIDNESGISYVKAQILSDPYGYNGETTIPLTYDSAKNKWVGKYQVKENDPDGQIEVFITASDKFFNNTYKSGYFHINNPEGDTEAPYTEYVKASASSANVGDSVHFEAKISDDKSGVKSATIHVGVSESDMGYSIPLTYDAAKDVWSVDYQIPAYAIAGLNQISLETVDNAGNRTYDYSSNDLKLWIFNEQPDTEGPIIEGLKVTPSQAVVGDKVEVKVQARDDYSGVSDAMAYLYYADWPKSSHYYYDEAKEIVLTFDAGQNAWIGTFTVKPTDLLGNWHVDVIVRDKAGIPTYADNTGKFTIVNNVVKSPKYDDAQWYYSQNNYYNAVYLAGAALAEGDARLEVQEFMNTAAKALLDAAATMSSVDAENAYQ